MAVANPSLTDCTGFSLMDSTMSLNNFMAVRFTINKICECTTP